MRFTSPWGLGQVPGHHAVAVGAHHRGLEAGREGQLGHDHRQQLRDQGRLEAAMFRPQIGYYNSLAEEAAALMESLTNNHAFVDGNKRISFAVTDTFLRVNGFYLEVDSAAAYRFITQAIAKGKFRFGVILEWILSNMKPLPD